MNSWEITLPWAVVWMFSLIRTELKIQKWKLRVVHQVFVDIYTNLHLCDELQKSLPFSLFEDLLWEVAVKFLLDMYTAI